MEPALLPEGLLQATVEVLDLQLWLRTEEKHPPVEVFQLHRKGHSHWRVAIQMDKPSKDLLSSRYFSWTMQHQEAHGDMKAGGWLPVRSRRGQEGGDLLLQLLETGEDSRSVGPEGDEVRGLFLRRATTTTFLLSLHHRG